MKYLQCDRKIALGGDVNMVLSCAMPYAVETQCCEDRYTCLRKMSVSIDLAKDKEELADPCKNGKPIIPAECLLNVHSTIHPEST
jgi:hypothetical protein